MDVAFMEKFYELKYTDPIVDLGLLDADFIRLRHQSYCDMDKLETRLKGIDKELMKMLDKALDDLGEMEELLIKRAYLQGAFDRERMLK